MAKYESTNAAVILFDGVCNLCNWTVKFIYKRDKKKKFRFASFQSEFSKRLLDKRTAETNFDSVILFHNNNFFTKSDAVIEISSLLGFPWNILRIFKILPSAFRDTFYDFIANNRYKWFGKMDACMIPSGKIKDLFFE